MTPPRQNLEPISVNTVGSGVGVCSYNCQTHVAISNRANKTQAAADPEFQENIPRNAAAVLNPLIESPFCLMDFGSAPRELPARKQLSLPVERRRTNKGVATQTSPNRARSGSLSTTLFRAGGSAKDVYRGRSFTAMVGSQNMSSLDRCLFKTKSNDLNSSFETLLRRDTDQGNYEDVLCMMPTGVVLEVSIHVDDIVFNIKQIVLNTATTSESLPLRGMLNPDARKYRLTYINQNGFRDEVFDERKTLRELKPFKNILKFVYRPKTVDNSNFKRFIGKLIGKDLRDYSKIQNCEVNDFRWKMKALANNLAQERRKRLEISWQDRICYQYPPRLIKSAVKCLVFNEFKSTSAAFDEDTSTFTIAIQWNGVTEKIRVELDQTADDLILELGAQLSFNPSRCCFKAVGEESYLLGRHKLVQFEFVYENLRTGRVPDLLIVREDAVDVESVGESIYLELERDVLSKPSKVRSQTQLPAAVTVPVVYSTDVAQPFCVFVESLKLSSDFLSVSPDGASSLPPTSVIGVRLGLYHGTQRLCPTVVHYVKGQQIEEAIILIQKTFSFDIQTRRLPRMTKLCIGIFEKRKNSAHPLYWVNAYVFDYKSTLRWRDTLQMWRYSMGNAMPTHERILSPLQHAVSNPDLREAADIILTFGPVVVSEDEADLSSTPVASESVDEVDALYALTPEKKPMEVLVQQQRIEFPPELDRDACWIGDESFCLSDEGSAASSCGSSGASSSSNYVSKFYAQELEKIADRDPLHDITVQEKELIWKVKEFCCQKLPHLLPRVIDCVDYSDPEQVAELHDLLRRWPPLPVERALQLLDYAYPDHVVRRYAVTCLRKHATDADVLLYLIQLAQALKHEAYLFSDLIEFLLERALSNQHIGHYLFWELRAEMHQRCSAVSLLYGLVLETYLVAAPEHSQLLGHQTTLLEKCRATALSLNKLETLTKSYDRAKKKFASAVKSQFNNGYHPYRNFVNPLNPNQKCKRIRLSKCQLMNSKMRPQMLTFENADNRDPVIAAGGSDSSADRCAVSFRTPAPDITLMFKKGDDLRQDELTLQLVAVMDRLWKEAGMDLRMQMYHCLATDANEGLIDVVSDAETICKIQMRSDATPTTAVFRKGLLLSWLKARNSPRGVQALSQAQEQFTLSCAGYSVAAYVLGIGDRHNDNIMVRSNGQMFHIDFGHILGNFKHKFGIKRERVPLLLSSEFVDVIKTPEFGRPRNFDRFRNLCERAYLTLRRHGYLLISLLAMMISTGLPELSSENDLNVVRSTLNLDRTEEEALEGFRKEFDESLRNAWKISLDWWFHMMNQVRTAKTPAGTKS